MLLSNDREENDLVREKKALAKIERFKKLKLPKPLSIVTPKSPKKKSTAKKEGGAGKPVATALTQTSQSSGAGAYEVSSVAMPRRSSTYAPPSPAEFEYHPGFEYGYEYGYESTPGEMEMSPVDGYFGSHYSSTSSLNNAMESYSFSQYDQTQESPYPVTPQSLSMPTSPQESSPTYQHFHNQQQEQVGEPLFPTKDHLGHRPSISRAYSTPQFQHGYAYPASPSHIAPRQPSGLCMYIGEDSAQRAAPAWTKHEETHHQQTLQSWTFPGVKRFPESPRSVELPPIQSQPPSPVPRPAHSRVASSPLVYDYKPVYRGPIDWTSRPLMPFPAQSLPLPPARPMHERTYSEYGTTTTRVQTVRLAEVCQTNVQN